MFAPPIQLSDVLIFCKVTLEPCLISERDKVRDVWAEAGNGIYIEMVVVRAILDVKGRDILTNEDNIDRRERFDRTWWFSKSRWSKPLEGRASRVRIKTRLIPMRPNWIGENIDAIHLN
jgi:hypothetical protein